MSDEHLLRRYVTESNKIEGIEAQPGDPHFDDHLEAARVAMAGRIVHPNVLHRILARRLPDLAESAGMYRRGGVMYVGNRTMPKPEYVPFLMHHWLRLVREYVAFDDFADVAEVAEFLHIWLLCVHPYADGNGRAARLVWNMLRVRKGLLWHIEPADTRREYFARIRPIESVFRERFSDMYPEEN